MWSAPQSCSPLGHSYRPSRGPRSDPQTPRLGDQGCTHTNPRQLVPRGRPSSSSARPYTALLSPRHRAPIPSPGPRPTLYGRVCRKETRETGSEATGQTEPSASASGAGNRNHGLWGEWAQTHILQSLLSSEPTSAGKNVPARKPLLGPRPGPCTQPGWEQPGSDHTPGGAWARALGTQPGRASEARRLKNR